MLSTKRSVFFFSSAAPAESASFDGGGEDTSARSSWQRIIEPDHQNHSSCSAVTNLLHRCRSLCDDPS